MSDSTMVSSVTFSNKGQLVTVALKIPKVFGGTKAEAEELKEGILDQLLSAFLEFIDHYPVTWQQHPSTGSQPLLGFGRELMAMPCRQDDNTVVIEVFVPNKLHTVGFVGPALMRRGAAIKAHIGTEIGHLERRLKDRVSDYLDDYVAKVTA